MNLFFGQKAKVTPKDSIVELRNTLQMLEKRETFLQTKIDNELKIAKANATKNRRAALMALKRKKQYEAQIEKISGSRLTIDTQVMAIENANVNLETMKAMRAGAAAIKGIHGAMDINTVDQTMEEIRDQMEIAEEISNAISQPVLFGVDMDEFDLAKELDELEQEELNSQLLDTAEPHHIGLPSVPDNIPAEEEDEEEADLRELQKSMLRTLRRNYIVFTNQSRTFVKRPNRVMSNKRKELPDKSDNQGSPKKTFAIFGPKPTKVLAPIRWETHSDSFIVGEAFSPKSGSKVAAFDLDQTLISVNGKHKWPKNSDDWVWWSHRVPEHLKKVSDSGYTIVVITNQGGLGGNPDKQEEMRSKFEKITQKVIMLEMQQVVTTDGKWELLRTSITQTVSLFSPTSTPLVPDSDTNEVIVFCGYPASGKSSFAHKHILPTGKYDYVNQDTLKTKEKCLKAVNESLKNKRCVVVDNTNADIAARAPYIALAKKYNVPVRCFLFTADRELAAHNNQFRAFHKPLAEVVGKARSKATAQTTVVTSKEEISVSTEVAPRNPIDLDEGSSSSSSSASTSSPHVKLTVTKVRDEPSRERLPEMVFATYAKKYQEPNIKEGFSEIKKINFVPDEDIRSTWELWYV
ncbi:ESCRT-III subunit protein snf7 [Entomortierella beljakovae]|nr:ESCRT-III subunit protein snf7 [Entomortierella beljakovae]